MTDEGPDEQPPTQERPLHRHHWRRGTAGLGGDMMIAKKWTMAKGKRETPCQCAQPIRVKIVEPGIYIRRCELCKRRMTYLLEEMEMLPGVLKLRWITDKEATAWVAAQRVDVADVEVGGL